MVMSIFLVLVCPLAYRTQAQVSSDGSLSTQVTTEDNLNFTIKEGDRAGNNLFHSFQEFSVPTNGSVIFNHSETIENIINRVTGDFPSNIDGLIEANSISNVFLINPNGVIFGENAILNIGGSFLATTAESLLFKDGIEFSTRNSNSKPLLTINVPLGVRFGNNPATIINHSQTETFNPFLIGRAETGLSVKPEKTLALIGGDINIDGGVITASQGTVQLGSVADNNVVNFDIATDSWTFDYSEVTQFQNIVLDNLAIVNTSGEGGGKIHLQGKEVRLLNGSDISADTFGAINGQDITINASDVVEIRGSDPTLQNRDPFVPGVIVPLPSSLSTNTFAQGNGGNIIIKTSDLFIVDGAKIESQTFNVSGNKGINFGDGGNILLEAQNSMVIQGAKPLIGLEENAEEIVLPRVDLERAIEINQAGIISTASISDGLGGDIKIFAGKLIVKDGNIISASPLDAGNGGNIIINAKELVEVVGTSPRSASTNSTIANSTFVGNANSGNIDITTENLRIKDGGAVSTTSASQGNAGNIDINALTIEIDGISPNPQFPSGLGTATFNNGNAGDLNIVTEELLVTNGANISVQGSSSGIPGRLKISAKSIELNNRGLISASTSSEQDGNINAINIDINVKENLILRNNSLISAQAFEDANGGNINISANFIIALPSESSDILANSFRGNGGNITITTEGIVGLEVTEGLIEANLSEINASSEFGQSGSVTIVTPEGQTAEPERDVKTEVVSLDKSSLDNYCRNLGKSSYIISGRGGIPLLSEQINSEVNNWEDWRIIEENTKSPTNSQNSNINAEISDFQQADFYPKLAQGWVINEQGKTILTAKPLVITPHPQQVTNHGC